MTPEQFYAQYLPYAQSVSQRTGLDPRLVLAQSALETGYGKSAPSMNFFGIKSHGRKGGNTLSTQEFEGGRMVQQPASFRGYETPEQSFTDYADFVTSNPRYKGVLAADGLEAQISEMAKSGYATDPNYGSKLASIASRFDPNSPKVIAAEAMSLLGKGPQTPTKGPQMMQEEKPRGLLGSLGIQKMEEGAEGETGQRFYNRDSFKDTAAVLAQGFGRMGIMGMEEIADSVAKQRTEVKAKNKTMEMLSKLPNGEHLMRVAEIAGPKAAVDLYVSEQKGGGVGGVQSSSALLDQSGVVLTLRDGSIQVKTAGGETLSGQEAMDFVRKSQETAANLQRDIYSARREGTNIAESQTGAAAAAAGKSGELTMDRGFKAYDDAVQAGSALRTMDEAIAAIDSGAKSGIVYNMLPNVTEASASLSNAMNRMGLDVISSVTFGALSESEMNLAMETAVPRGLAPDALRSWLVEKRDAQAKARDALMNAARYLTQPQNTLSGWMGQQAAKAPAPAPSGGGATRLKFNPETGEFE